MIQRYPKMVSYKKITKVIELNLIEELYEVKISGAVLRTSYLWQHRRLNLTN